MKYRPVLEAPKYNSEPDIVEVNYPTTSSKNIKYPHFFVSQKGLFFLIYIKHKKIILHQQH